MAQLFRDTIDTIEEIYTYIFREEIIEEEEEELLSLSPQPSILSTVTHGANNNRNSLKPKSQQVKGD